MRSYGRALVALGALVFVFSLVHPAAQQQPPKKTKEQEKFEKALQAEIQALVQVVNQAAAGESAPSDIPLSFANHYLKARDARTYSPFVLTIPPDQMKAPQILLYFRLVKKGPEAAAAAPEAKKDDKAAQGAFAFEDVHGITVPAVKPGDPHRLMRAFSVPGGEYELWIALRERAAPGGQKQQAAKTPPRTTVYHQPVTVPDFWADKLATSSIILADQVDQLATPPTEQQMIVQPYTFGLTQILPSTDHAYTKSQNLSILFLVYNTATDANKKPNVTVDFSFYQQLEGGEKFFNRTNPQDFNAETLPPQFDPAAGHQIVAGQEIPLASFPEGKYRLVIKVTDKIANQSLTEAVTFAVNAS